MKTKRQTVYKTSKENREEECSNTISDNEHKNDGENIVRTRYERIVKKPDRIMYEQKHINISAANMSGAVQKSNILPPFQHKRNTFSFGFLSNWPTTQHASLYSC